MRDIKTNILPAFKIKTELIIIPDPNYNKTQKASHSKSDFKFCICPVCEQNIFTYHCQYEKYHYNRRIRIIRVLCLNCKSTHALIPECSLPGTSIGTEEANHYMKERSRGISQVKSSSLFTSQGMSSKYGVSLEKRFQLAHRKAQSLFPDATDLFHNPAHLFTLNRENEENIVLTINYQFSERGYNPLYFSRNNILRIREIKLGPGIPLNPGATEIEIRRLDSS